MIFNDNFRLKLLHINYALRGDESEQDQLFVEDLGKQYGIEVIVYKVSDKSSTPLVKRKNVQAWARKIRQNIFKELAQKNFLIALAHQKDDLTETILLRMSRGVSPGSLLGMRKWNPPFWRPLLDIDRTDILTWLQKNSFNFRSDSSNESLDYSRNVVRHMVLPHLLKLNAQAKEHIVRCAMETQDFVDFARNSILKPRESRENIEIDSNILKNLPKGVAYDVLSCCIGRNGENGAINHNILEDALRTSIRSSDVRAFKQLVQLPGDRRLVRKKDGRISVMTVNRQRNDEKSDSYKANVDSRSKEPKKLHGASKDVDFFPIPAGIVLDQKFQKDKSDHIN